MEEFKGYMESMKNSGTIFPYDPQQGFSLESLKELMTRDNHYFKKERQIVIQTSSEIFDWMNAKNKDDKERVKYYEDKWAAERKERDAKESAEMLATLSAKGFEVWKTIKNTWGETNRGGVKKVYYNLDIKIPYWEYEDEIETSYLEISMQNDRWDVYINWQEGYDIKYRYFAKDVLPENLFQEIEKVKRTV